MHMLKSKCILRLSCVRGVEVFYIMDITQVQEREGVNLLDHLIGGNRRTEGNHSFESL